MLQGSFALFRHGGLGLLVGLDIVSALKAVHNHHFAVNLRGEGNLRLHQRGNVHNPGEDGGVAVGGALAGHKGQDLVLGQLHRLAGGEILGDEDARLLHLEPRAAAAENVHQPPRHVLDIHGAGFHILVIHGGEGSREGVAGLMGGLGGAGAAGNHLLDALDEVQIVEHHDLHVQNHGLFLADLPAGLLKERLELFPGGLPGGVEVFQFDLAVAAGGGQLALAGEIDVGFADGNAGEYRPAGSFPHLSHPFLTSSDPAPCRQAPQSCRCRR